MPIQVEAIYANGVLKPAEPLALHENEKVRLLIVRVEDAVQRVQASADLIPCTDGRMIEAIVTDPDLEFPAPNEA